MRACASILVLLALTSSAAAFRCRLPPARYDHEPTRNYRVILDANLYGNAFTSPDRSLIILPAHSSAAWRACYLRHEKGHVNGWGAHHPGMRRADY